MKTIEILLLFMVKRWYRITGRILILAYFLVIIHQHHLTQAATNCVNWEITLRFMLCNKLTREIIGHYSLDASITFTKKTSSDQRSDHICQNSKYLNSRYVKTGLKQGFVRNMYLFFCSAYFWHSSKTVTHRCCSVPKM